MAGENLEAVFTELLRQALRRAVIGFVVIAIAVGVYMVWA